MQFNDLLTANQFDPKDLLIMRHRPQEPQLRDVLPWFAAEKPDVFNAYQSSHSEKWERVLQRAKYLASFIGHRPSKALFIGLYRVAGWKSVSVQQWHSIPENRTMDAFGHIGPDPSREPILWFDLKCTEFRQEWKGRLIVGFPPPDRGWCRWAARNVLPVSAILEESLLNEKMPNWRQLMLSWEELHVIPSAWKAALREWRGIYFIFDVSQGRGYVGSACGKENLLGRWLNYAQSGDGGNKRLKGCQPQNLRFTILERLNPDLDRETVVRLEGEWKWRLHTRSHGLNLN